MAKSPEVKLAVFGRAGVGKSGEAPLPLHLVRGEVMEAFPPPYVASLPLNVPPHPSIF